MGGFEDYRFSLSRLNSLSLVSSVCRSFCLCLSAPPHHPQQQQQQQQQLRHHHEPQEPYHYQSTVLRAGPTTPSSLPADDDSWRHYRGLALEATRQMDPSDPRHKAVPLPYVNAYCLDDGNNRRSSSFGYPSTTFQVTSRDDGHLYCLRRFDNVRSVSPKIAAAVTERWNNTNNEQSHDDPHPNVVAFYHCFVAQRAVFFCHAYTGGARTLRERLVERGPLAEPAVWSCIAQLVSALRHIHVRQRLAARTVQLQHVLCSDNNDTNNDRLRLRINCVGILDALEFEARKHVADLQRQDVRDLGCLILSLATGTEVTAGTDASTLHNCESYVGQNYSRELHTLAVTLIRAVPPSIVDVCRAIASRGSMEEQDAAYRALDRTERALATEYDAGRVMRMMLKLGFVNERPEFGPNRRWSQSGDCYVLKLFRDYGT
jgi:PAB-dependent poly(A)-specific ribonuclease subunit 3